ncbi:hypothetical protein E2542_SST22503 [Spatholobus suberectus]|nr:hypothetical protein E2542_SST22503 [Spatholobus suberectus]
MAWRSGSVSRSLISTARASLRPAAPSPLPSLRPPPLAAPRIQSRRFSMPASRSEAYIQNVFLFFFVGQELGAIGVHTITFTSAQYDGYNLHDVTRCCQCACLLRAVPWYLPSFLSRSLVVSFGDGGRGGDSGGSDNDSDSGGCDNGGGDDGGRGCNDDGGGAMAVVLSISVALLTCSCHLGEFIPIFEDIVILMKPPIFNNIDLSTLRFTPQIIEKALVLKKATIESAY